MVKRAEDPLAPKLTAKEKKEIRDTDTAMHKEILGENLDAPWPEEVLAALRIKAEQMGIWPGLVQR